MSGKTEARLQQDCFIWFNNNYPKLRGLLCYNLNNSGLHLTSSQVKNAIGDSPLVGKILGLVKSLNIRVAVSNKSLGLQAGRSDMVLYYNGCAYMIEFKKELKGIQSQKQEEWEAKVMEHSFTYTIVDTKKDFQELIRRIVGY